MRVGANSSDQNKILAMHGDEVTPKQISKLLNIELKTVKSFIKAGKSNFDISRGVDAKIKKEAEATPVEK